MKNIIAKLIVSVAALTVSATLVAMFSYAWLTISGAPEVDGIQISIGGGNTIMVAADISAVNDDGTVSHYPGEFSQTLDLSGYDTYDFLSTLAGLTPVSTSDGVNWVRPTYYGEDSEEAKSGEVLVGQIRDIEDFAVDTKLEYANLSSSELKNSMMGNYVYLDFWVVSPADGYELRVSTGGADDESGSFVISRMEASENEDVQYGYDFSMVNEATTAAVRIGFLVSNDWCTYVDNIKYTGSAEYDSRYTFLKGQYFEKGSNAAFSAENSTFTIYEPNGNLHLSKEYDEEYYRITSPLGVTYNASREPNIQAVSISDRLTVQLNSRWSLGAGGIGTMIGQKFTTFLAGKDIGGKTASELTESFYSENLQNVVFPYVDRGKFIKNTAARYNGANGRGYVLSDSDVLANVSGATDNTVITTLEKNVPQRIRMFIWLEGQDEDCVNYGEISSFIVNLELAGSNDK